jgi:hypothetical protein
MRAIALSRPNTSLIMVHPADYEAAETLRARYELTCSIAPVASVGEAVAALGWNLRRAEMSGREKPASVGFQARPASGPGARSRLALRCGSGRRIATGMAGLFALVIIVSLAWLRARHCVPMSVDCLLYSQPRFERDEIGVLIERRAYHSEVDMSIVRREVEESLTFAISHANDEMGTLFRRTKATEQVRVVAVPRIDEEVIKTTGAMLGIRGSVELRVDPETGRRMYYFTLAEVLLNLARLGEPDRKRGAVATQLVVPRESDWPDAFMDYRPRGLLFPAPFLVRTQTRAKRPDQMEFKLHYPVPKRVADGYPMRPQNLNYSIRGEFAAFDDPQILDSPLEVVATRDISNEAIGGLLAPVVFVRAFVQHIYGESVSEKNLSSSVACSFDFPEQFARGSFYRAAEGATITIDGRLLALLAAPEAVSPLVESWPPLFRAITLRFFAETLTLLLSSAGDDPREFRCVSPPVRAQLAQWATLAKRYYGTAIAADERICAGCYDRVTQLAYASVRTSADELEFARSLLQQPSGSGKESDTRRALVTVKYLAGVGDNPVFGSDQGRSDLQRLWESVDKGGDTAQATFERARWLLCHRAGAADGATLEALLRDVLKVRPKHALTRLLLAKVLRHRGANADAATILSALAEDLNAAGASFQMELHSLGEHDLTLHSVPFAVVIEDLLEASMAACNATAALRAVDLSRSAPSSARRRLQRIAEGAATTDTFAIFPCRLIINVERVHSTGACEDVQQLRERVRAAIATAWQ